MDVISAIKTRRAYRSLEAVSITDELISDLAECAGLAPSCFNKQPWRYVFVSEPGQLAAVKTAMSPGNEWTFDASMIIAVCCRKEDDCQMKDGREYYMFDTGMATAALIYRATELGLVAHPIAGYDQNKAKEILGVPAEITLLTLVNVGKHAAEISPRLKGHQIEDETTRPTRLPPERFAFRNKYGKT
ncbi:nitroreductase [candidate division WOR-1 bacterium RIFOXYA12_FULL_52_29]|uniref:Nitroreductase n=1 Tax=candidate division WOR-1 bacterium RIFOXYC12_FULL_54_18 TaxID=1802584 RepID=A0A1F4T9H7_UNCSA|nr:MAG: nitroreductase [candidate division WOR-1 bacterium RIFOXYA2_FULL_51_19]OGC18296.1 MAG: nitroreductase [candidate division WOR-1 bacterium RIFOXYA12_FULL_52_29]OGC27151.1 MAG: nitroreductase [candidate division WOR-1 bacterium RIFOXYB2_FULL_45_9]OGC28713.1 MAG: nitroreductase [candidate division WOR-1 bacterium RIFOXYC12_FULL_54_18]OGC30832.1 MAG: nitroreductase [candidate division WOR-1 bacterium RIFOXYB12_FULL_52_16]